ncbi:hypothetical protein [Candidatus Uabimicrobium amorphum]|uniref:hypothetical protein n=1 Tax=Uabimicrobium amorphum TaxID=2596890 RepID=UPI00125F92B7|nr:hypothetical protein [Candidatus Uabimicrobium amorphum]
MRRFARAINRRQKDIEPKFLRYQRKLVAEAQLFARYFTEFQKHYRAYWEKRNITQFCIFSP